MKSDIIENRSFLLNPEIRIPIKINHPPNSSEKVLILAHGLFNNMDNELFERLADQLSKMNTTVIRFNFPFHESTNPIAKSKEMLDKSFIEVIELTYKEICQKKKLPYFIGGKSLGALVSARITEKLNVLPHGLVFLGYPLHKPEKENDLRDDILYSIKIPIYFFVGSKDPFCSLDKLAGILFKLKKPSLEVIEGGGHSFENTKNKMTTVYSNMSLLINDWMLLNI